MAVDEKAFGKDTCGADGAIALMRAEKPARDVPHIWRLADCVEIHRIVLCFVENSVLLGTLDYPRVHVVGSIVL